MREHQLLVRLLSVLALTVFASSSLAQGRPACPAGEEPQGVVVALDGDVTARGGTGAPFVITVGSVLCPLDQIRTGTRSRVEFRLVGRDTTTGTSSNAVTVIPEPDSECLTLLGGILSFISSVRGRHCVRTPFIDAGIEGTEAIVAVDATSGDSFVLVRSGVVEAVDRREPRERLALGSGSAGAIAGTAAFATSLRPLTVATPENVPAKFRDLLLDPDGATDWAIYYPPILLGTQVDDPTVARAAALLDAGDPAGAAALLAGTRLVGPAAAAGLALRAVAAVARNDLAAGAALADEAVALDPGLGAGHIARSYALQADGRLGAARDAAEAAVTATPQDAYAWARLAELQLTIGNRRAASDAIARSLALAETALGRSIEGYAELASGDSRNAEAAFRRAIEIDSEAPLPRLGLGLANIRQGRVAEGRLEMETAVALDPRRASLRTWLGRAYLAEGRPEKALRQFGLAKERDPDDPNPNLFEALALFGGNRPIEALKAVEAAQERNENRSVVRSPQGLGEDRAVQGAALGRIYNVLGLDQLAIAEGARAVEADPDSAEAHRFLAEVYSGRRGAGIAQTSELLKADLLGPPSSTPLQLQLAEADLELLPAGGPARVTFSEFAPVFAFEPFQFEGSATVGTQQTLASEASAAVLYKGVSLAVSQLHYETEGFRLNNDLSHDVAAVQAKAQVTPELMLFSEFRSRDTEGGDRPLNFVVSAPLSATQRNSFQRELGRVGFRYEPTDSLTVLGLASAIDLETRSHGDAADRPEHRHTVG